MKIHIKYAAMLGLFFILTTGCAVRKQAQDFFPLKPGNVWQYDVDVQGENIQMMVEVGEPQIVEGDHVFPFSYSYHELALPTQVEYYKVEDNAVLFPRIDNIQGQFLKKPIQEFLQFPLSKGKKWGWSGKLVPVGINKESISGDIVTVVKDIETVTTPAGTYKNAYRISINSKFQTQGSSFSIKEDRWYVKGVGMVKEVLYDDRKGEVLTAVLKKFSIGR
ncbi:MAG: hypothetical protein ACOX4L_02935 [Bacillota bacterium]|jgi:hypothetical protein